MTDNYFSDVLNELLKQQFPEDKSRCYLTITLTLLTHNSITHYHYKLLYDYLFSPKRS